MTSTWARVCDLCGTVGTMPPGEGGVIPVPEGWFHKDTGLFQHTGSIDVCKNCCTSKLISALRDKLDERKGLANVVANRT
jgi:hypothetical protein